VSDHQHARPDAGGFSKEQGDNFVLILRVEISRRFIGENKRRRGHEPAAECRTVAFYPLRELTREFIKMRRDSRPLREIRAAGFDLPGKAQLRTHPERHEDVFPES